MVSGDQQTILLRIRPMNRALVLARRAAGFESVAELCRAHPKLYQNSVGDLENLRAPARGANGELRPVAERLCKIYKLDEEILFPLELDNVRGGDREMSLTSRQMLLASQASAAGVFGGSQPLNPEEALELKELQADVYEAVGDRAAAVLAMRHDGFTLDEAGSLIGLARGGASNIVKAAGSTAKQRLGVAGTVKEWLTLHPQAEQLYYGVGVQEFDHFWWIPASEPKHLPKHMQVTNSGHVSDCPFSDLEYLGLSKIGGRKRKEGECVLLHRDGWTAITWWDRSGCS